MDRSTVEAFIRGTFARYYHDNPVQPPTSMEKREFGFLLFRERMMVRHKTFRVEEDLRNFIESTTPSDVYYSAAYYERADEEMSRKGWLGADLIFDIDVDHIHTPCRIQHAYWICKKCEEIGRGVPPSKCPKCEGENFREEIWPCETCMEATKMETLKLIDFLTNDFGFSSGEIEVFFSGHRGYHVHVENERIRSLDQLARKEIVDYILGTGLKAEFHGLSEKGEKMSRMIVGPDLNDEGWRGRIARGVYDFLTSATPESPEKFEGVGRGVLKKFIVNRDALIEAWKRGTPWKAVRGVGIKTWEKILKYALREQGATIDTVVTTDIHRLIRMPTTLHGKTGFNVVEIPVKDLEGFDPFSGAVSFKGDSVTVHVNWADKFRIGDSVYGPYEKERVELPQAAAVFLLCKGVAEPVVQLKEKG